MIQVCTYMHAKLPMHGPCYNLWYLVIMLNAKFSFDLSRVPSRHAPLQWLVRVPYRTIMHHAWSLYGRPGLEFLTWISSNIYLAMLCMLMSPIPWRRMWDTIHRMWHARQLTIIIILNNFVGKV